MKVHLLISGRVQGVFYRAYTKKKAEELGLNGWVKNRADGRVEAVFSGDKKKIEEMIKWCWRGSPASRVREVKIVTAAKTAKKGTTGFQIRY